MIIGGILLIIILWVISSYNGLVHSISLVNEAWSGIDVQLKRRYDLIPNLVETVKGYSIHEKGIVDSIVQARAASMGATNVGDKEKAEYALTASLKSLFALAEQYPNLKANENFLSLQAQLSAVEQELQLSRRYYNGTVRQYMVYVMQFPSNIIAKLFNFAPVSYFEVTSSEERNNPSVKF